MATTRTVVGTGNKAVDGLLSGIAWSGPVTFSFPDSPADYEASYGQGETTSAFDQASLALMQAARVALAGGSDTAGGHARLAGMGVADFTNLTLLDAGFDSADLRIAQSSRPPTAYAYLPASGRGGDVWFGTAYAGSTNDYANPILGNYAYHTILHELGHALGLKHAHEAGGVANTAVPADRDSLEFTVMTYRSAIGGSTAGYTYERWGAPQSFMMLDIAALQVMYGADFAMNGGDTTYSWNPLTGAMSINGAAQGTPGGNRVFLTIWDGDGRDTYDFSAYGGGVKLDLTPGGWSVASSAQLVSLAAGKLARGNVFNALQFNGDARSLIENATGGAGNDTLTGNAAANLLQGGAGNDSLAAAAGADTLDGGTGSDSLAGGLGDDSYILRGAGCLITELVGGGSDTVFADVTHTLGLNVENLTLTGDAAIDGAGNAVANIITGNAAANRLSGGSGNDLLAGGAGADTLEGGSGADTLVGGLGDDCFIVASAAQALVEQADEGTDLVISLVTWTLTSGFERLTLSGTAAIGGTGNAAANLLTGNAGANHLAGLAGDDTLAGGAGADTLDGGTGADSLAGGEGTDTYIVDAPDDSVLELGATGIDQVLSGVSWSLGSALEWLVLTGTAATAGTGNALANRITGNSAANALSGGAAADTLAGNAGADTLDGGSGADSLAGGTGDDVYRLDDGGDCITEAANAGTDRVLASVTAILGTNLEDLALEGDGAIQGTGNTLANFVTGNDAANLLAGLAGADTLRGDGGDDTLVGGAGADQMTGGVGLDAFRFASVLDAADTILDFSAADDRLEFSASGFGAGLRLGMDLLAAGRLQIGASPAAIGTLGQFLFSTGTHQLIWDSNGATAGGITVLASLADATVMAADFVVIA